MSFIFAQLPERLMHRVRWVLTVGWLFLIASLLYDPWTAALTEPNHPWSPLRLTEECVMVQGKCIAEEPYPIGATIFWGAVVPSGILILLVFGHELWRRICPLSFLSQIPRGLGRQRQFKHENQKTGKVRYEIAKVKSESWLGRNYLYLQFAYLFVGLCGRILFFNADRLVLALWILSAIAGAIFVGYWYGGKSWCQYFCPMAPVQTIFSEPRGLLGSKAHMSESRITQSMCRTVTPEGVEQSACVACQSPCFDIDSERTYWHGLNKPEETLIRYGYVGLVVGYFVYYYLYAGNWDYYFSGVWNRDPNQLAQLMNPGLYLLGQAIPIPKLFAVPLVLGTFTAIAYFTGQFLEKQLKSYYHRRCPNLNPDVIQHRIFAVCTFIAFNFFFFFAGRPLLRLMPGWVQYGFDFSILFFSTLWLQQTWRRSADLYSRENLANRFRKQLERLDLDLAQYLEGRALDDLNASEVYVLAKVLPGFDREKRHEAYKGVVREALAEGYVNYSSSLEVLQQMRQELDISDDEHREVLEELGIEDPELLNPNRQRSLENQIRLNGYQKSLERLMLLQQRQLDLTTFEPSPQDSEVIRSLRREYSISAQEEDWILSGLTPNASAFQKVDFWRSRLAAWAECDRALHQPGLAGDPAVIKLLQTSLRRKQELIVQSIFATLATLPQDNKSMELAQSVQQLAPHLVAQQAYQSTWQNQLSPDILQVFTQVEEATFLPPLKLSTADVLSRLEILIHAQNALIQAAALFLTAQFDPERGQIAAQALQTSPSQFVQESAKRLLTQPANLQLSTFPQLEKLVYLATCEFFQDVQPETLMKLSDRAEIRTYSSGGSITEAGDTCRELLLLLEGHAEIRYPLADGQVRVERFHPEQLLDELEVLTRSAIENTIVAQSDQTRILAIPVDAFDDLLDHDPKFARRVLELESQHLKRFVHSF
jgi:hypothetical protein